MPASRAQRARTAERRSKAIALRLAGMDWQAIADKVGYASRGAACTDVTRSLHHNLKVEEEQADLMRYQETQRLNRLQASLWPQAIQGDVKSAEAVLKIIDRRVRLYGLDAPERTDVTLTPVTPGSEEERAQQMEQLHAELMRRMGAGDAEALLSVPE